jgi:hypothetical protein
MVIVADVMLPYCVSGHPVLVLIMREDNGLVEIKDIQRHCFVVAKTHELRTKTIEYLWLGPIENLVI